MADDDNITDITANLSAAEKRELRKRQRSERHKGKKPQTGKIDRKKMTPYRLQLREKEKQCLELRLAGWSWAKIAEQVGYEDPSSAFYAVQRLMKEEIREPAEDLRNLEVMRCDRMIAAMWPKVIEGKWLAVDRVLKIQERKALLLGLDAPQRKIVEVVTQDAWESRMEELNGQIAELESGKEPEGPPIPVDLEKLKQGVLMEGVDLPEAEIVDAEVVPDAPENPSS